jgi:predicted nucleic acid-binding protein
LIFIDSNVPMYLIGAEHPNKKNSQRILKDLILSDEPLVTDAEVLQEILHRYVAINRKDAIQPAFDVLIEIVDEVFPVDTMMVEKAKEIVLTRKKISARDALHLAVMKHRDISRIFTFDTGFDHMPGIERLG